MTLYEDVKKLVLLDIGEINYIADLDRFLPLRSNSTLRSDEGGEEEDLYRKYHCLEKRLQLALNMKNNEDYFRLCRCNKTSPNETAKECNEEEMIGLIIDYIECKQAIICREIKSQNFVVEKCDLCDTEIVPDDEQCSVCNEPVKEIISRTKRKLKDANDINDNKKPKIGNGSVAKDVEISNVNEVEENKCEVNVNRNLNESIETDLSLQDCCNSNPKTTDDSNIDPNYTILSGNKDKWLCKGCTFLNSYLFINCQICEKTSKEFGIWICERCECMNEAVVNKCSVCETENSRMKSTEKSKNNKNTQIKPKSNDLPKWICWKEDCKQSNSIDREFCDKCKLQRDPSSGETDLVKMMIKGKITDIWFCWNKDCKKSNEDNYKFCFTCKLQRRPPENAADLVKKATGGKISEIWICQKCQKHNIDSDAKCKNNCGAYRFYTGALKTNEMKCNEYRGINENKNGIKERNGEHCKSLIDDGNKKKHNLDKKQNINNNNKQWTCFYCGKPNELSNEYCQDCCLDRHGSHDQGAVVKYKSQKNSKAIWFCYSCKKYNIPSDATCGGRTCKQTRFVSK